jgi:hypothetical protein
MWFFPCSIGSSRISVQRLFSDVLVGSSRCIEVSLRRNVSSSSDSFVVDSLLGSVSNAVTPPPNHPALAAAQQIAIALTAVENVVDRLVASSCPSMTLYIHHAAMFADVAALVAEITVPNKGGQAGVVAGHFVSTPIELFGIGALFDGVPEL